MSYETAEECKIIPPRVEPRRLCVHMVLRQFYPHITGVVTQYRQLGPELQKRGINLVVNTAQTELATAPEDHLEGIKIVRSKLTIDGEALHRDDLDHYLLEAFRSECYQTGKYPDALIVFGITRKLLPHYLALKKHGVRIILALTIFPEFDNGRTFLAKLKWYFNTFTMLNLFDAITVYSTTFVKLYTSAGVPKKKLHVLPFPVDCHKFSPLTSASHKKQLRQTLNLPVEGPMVVFVGSVIQRKGADLLLAAWLLVQKSHPQAKLVFVGPYGPRETHLTEALRIEHEQFLEKFQSLLNQLDDRHSVIMAGSVDNPQDYFRAADIFAFPSLLEGMGGVIPEAMACELPSVLTRFDGFPEVEFGTPGEHFLLADFTPESIATQIRCLLENPDECQRIGKKARQRALDIFALPIIGEKLAAICR